jgi:lysophospholipase L1-like esterase
MNPNDRSQGITPQPKRSQIRRGRRYAVVALAALVLALAAAEAVLRFAFGLGNPILIQADPACDYLLKPDQDVVRFFVRTRINHYGMRADEIPSARQPGSLRLMFVGDSLTYGTTQVGQDRIFTEVLHRALPAIEHRPVEVLNASAGAWAPDNELEYVQSRGIFNSDIVLLVLNDGDLTQPRATIADIGENLPQKRPATAIGELYSRYLRPRILQAVEKHDAGDSVAVDAGGVMRHNLADLDEFAQLVNTAGARMILVYVPFRRDIPGASKDSAAAFHAWSDAHRVAMADLTAAEIPYSVREITLRDGIHFNAKGNDVIATAIEKAWPDLMSGK